MIRERLQHIQYNETRDGILAVGRKGGLYLLDLDLNVVQASTVTNNTMPTTCIVSDDQFVVTKDNFGTIIRWDLHTLQPIDVLHSGEFKDESELDEEDAVVPSVNHALALLDGKVYALNGFGQVLELDMKSFKLLRVLDPNKSSFVETIETGKPGQQVLSDFSGHLYFGDLASGEFEKRIRVDQGPSHCVRYDRRHDRYWVTTDNSGGFAIVAADGSSSEFVKMTNDDVEWIDFDETHDHAYIACFDHHLYVYSNESEQVELKRVIGPFKFQLKQVLCLKDDQIFVLLESGEIYKLDPFGNIQATSPLIGNCVWGVDAHPADDSIVYCGLEDGSVAIARYGAAESYGAVEIEQLQRHRHSFGRVRRARPLPDGSYVGVASSGTVFRASREGSLLWYRKVPGICRDVDLNVEFSKALVGTEGRHAEELDVESGEIIAQYETDWPVWAVCYTEQGQLMIGSRRKHIHIYETGGHAPVAQMEVLDNVKRFRRLNNGNILMNGPEGVIEIDPKSWEIVKRWDEWITTTCENALVFENRLYAVSYNMMMNTYRYDDCEILDNQITLHDFPKGIVARTSKTGKKLLLIGGRGPYLSVYQLGKEGIPQKVRDLFL